MEDDLSEFVSRRSRLNNGDPRELLDILREVQARFKSVSPDAIDRIAREFDIPQVMVEDTASFYSFLSKKPKGRISIRIGDCIMDEQKGSKNITDALKSALGIDIGSTTDDGMFSFDLVPYIGVPDQAPAIMVNEVILTHVKPETIPDMVGDLKKHGDPRRLVTTMGDGNNSNILIGAMIRNNIRLKGQVIFQEVDPGAAVRHALTMDAGEVIRTIQEARIRGRGGAGFPTGMKWGLARREGIDGQRCVICNADEGEPGTFKDRVLLTERHDLVFDGMTICAYAIKARYGILYLRAEYAYLKEFLEHALERRRIDGLLGGNILGKKGFDFDVRIKLGAGAYICGEETALINSCEGLRGDPRNRPPFPVRKGYRGLPTVVNNVQTFCCAARVIEKGAAWFTSIGKADCPGTAVLSVSGDCVYPGVFETPFGVRLGHILDLSGAKEPAAVAVGGPSGEIVGEESFSRTIAYEDLATSGSVMVFNGKRDLLGIVEKFIDFFAGESCGHCTPCRVGTSLLQLDLRRVRSGRGDASELGSLERCGAVMKAASRCGLGATAPNPILSTLKGFRRIYEEKLRIRQSRLKPSFDIYESIALAEKIAGRKSTYFPH